MSIVAVPTPQTSSSPADSTRQREIVVLVHGFAAPSWVMWPIARRLQKAGFETTIWTYASYRGRLREHSERLLQELTALANQPDVAKVHVVAHSMGTIVARGALRKMPIAKLGRVVLLAPPNRGVNWGTWFGPIVKFFLPTVYDLAASPASYVNNLPTPDQWFVGIIRADFDLLIPRWSVELSEQMDFMTFPTLHSGLLFRRDVGEAVQAFLQTGAFPMPPRQAR